MTQGPQSTPDIKALLGDDSGQLRQLLSACYVSKTPGPLTPAQLAERIAAGDVSIDHTLLVSLQLQLTPDKGLDQDSYGLAAFVDQLFNNYHKNTCLHPTMQKVVDRFRLPALLSLCREHFPWEDKASPVRFLRYIIPAVCGWQVELGRAGQNFLDKLSPITEQLACALDEPQQKALVDQLQQFLEGERQRIAKLEQRLRDAEIGQLHARFAAQLTARTLNQQMGGKRLPPSISRFLQGPWRESMRLTLLQQGKDSDAWRKIVRLTETLVWTFQPIGDDPGGEKHQHIYDSISELSEQLRETVVGLHHSNDIDQELAQVEAEHLKILKQQSLEYQPFELIGNTDPLLSAQVAISNSLIKKVGQINEGQWFIHHADDGDVRIKLTIKIDDVQQLLFTNFLGIKTRQFSYEEFAYMLSSKIAVPLSQRDILKTMGEKMLLSLMSHYQGQQPQATGQPAPAAADPEQFRQAARDKALLEARAHAEVARLKSQANASASSQAAEPAPQPTATAAPVSAPQSPQAAVASLLRGARIAFRNEAEVKVCRLAAIMQATGRYIFVNKEGIKELSFSREELTELVANQQAEILDQGSDSGSALEQVVNNFRTRK